MNGKDLLEGMSYVDERFVDEAETKMIPQRTGSPWLRIAAIAAGCCLVLFSVYNLNQLMNRSVTEGAAEGCAADQIWPQQGPESDEEREMQQEALESDVISPEDRPGGEVPSVIVHVEEMTDIGFIGTVAELVDTDIFEIGMKLNVVIAEGTRHETADGNPAVSADSKTNLTGTYVMVQFTMYNQDTGTIVVNIIRETETPEGTP